MHPVESTPAMRALWALEMAMQDLRTGLQALGNGPPEKPRAKGNALPRSSLDIDRQSEVTDQDIAEARKSWKRRAPEPFKGLIDAEPDPKDS